MVVLIFFMATFGPLMYWYLTIPVIFLLYRLGWHGYPDLLLIAIYYGYSCLMAFTESIWIAFAVVMIIIAGMFALAKYLEEMDVPDREI